MLFDRLRFSVSRLLPVWSGSCEAEVLSLTSKGRDRFERLASEAAAFQRWLERNVNIAYLSSLDSGLVGLEDLVSTGHLRAPQRQTEEPLA